MKRFFFRIILLICIFIGMHIYPVFSFVIGGLIFGLFFKAPFDLICIGFYFEIITGIPPGIITIPLLSGIMWESYIRGRIRDMQYTSYAMTLISGIFVFLLVQGIYMLFEGGIGVFGFKIIHFL